MRTQPQPEPEFGYVHQRSAEEPLLWIPDAIAWAWGRGGHWKAQVESLGLIASLQVLEVP